MATTVPETSVPDTGPAAGLPLVRRLTALGFRSWPAATTTFDGTWAIRLTAGSATNRQNSVNPLDPGDTALLAERIERAAARFRAFGRPPTFLISPLAPPVLDEMLAARGWSAHSESLVMLGDLDAMALSHGLDAVPLADTGRWLDAQVALSAFGAERRPGVAETIAAIRPSAHPRLGGAGLQDTPVELHLTEDAGRPVAALAAIRLGSHVGLFQIVTDPARRREGHARRLIASALINAARQGATQAWLQVERDNAPALGLYESLGFREVHGYRYRSLAP